MQVESAKTNVVKLDCCIGDALELLEELVAEVKSGRLPLTKVCIVGEGVGFSLRKHNKLRCDEIIYMLERCKFDILNERD